MYQNICLYSDPSNSNNLIWVWVFTPNITVGRHVLDNLPGFNSIYWTNDELHQAFSEVVPSCLNLETDPVSLLIDIGQVNLNLS